MTIASLGCTSSEQEPDSKTRALLATLGPKETRSSPRALETHDFGTVLAQGQNLTHSFILKNPSASPRRILGAMALTPCCSSIGPLPQSIPPGGQVSVPTILKASPQSGYKRVEFVVGIDEPGLESHRFSLSADFLSAFEIEPLNPDHRPLRIGQEGSRRFLIISRRNREAGLGTPSAVEASPPLSVLFKTPPTETDLGDGFLETRTEVEVHLPASDREGPRSGEFRVQWTSGESREYALSWQVTPWIRATPTSIVLDESHGRSAVSITLATDDIPFKLLDISGPRLLGHSELPDESRRMHKVRLDLDPSEAVSKRGLAPRGACPRLETAATNAIQIMTDRPEQPVVRLGVIVIPAETGGKP